jgi:hypothetical protein
VYCTRKCTPLSPLCEGFIPVKTFTAEDGEVLALAEFDSLDALQAWKEPPAHVVA